MVMWSGQQVACFGSCQLSITCMPKIKDEVMVVVLLSYFLRYWRTYGRTVTWQPKFFRSMGYQIFLGMELLSRTCIQLFQLTLSDQSIKLEDQTARLYGIFFLNKFMETSYALPVQWRFIIASHLDDRNSRISSRWGSGCFKDGKSRASSLLPHKKTSVSFIQVLC